MPVPGSWDSWSSAKVPLDGSMPQSDVEMLPTVHDAVLQNKDTDVLTNEDANVLPNEDTDNLPNEDADRRAAPLLVSWIVFMVLTGGGVDFFADVFNDSVPNTQLGKDAAVLFTTALGFLACAIPPTFNALDRASLKAVNAANSTFKFKVVLPGLGDLFVTGLRNIAILFVSPSSVSLLKTSTQLVILGVYKHCKGKKLTWRQASCLLVACLGEVTVTVAGSLRHVPGIDSDPGIKAIGMLLAVMSGVLGAGRNLVEETVLQGDDLSVGALLMVEAWISFFGMVFVTLLWNALGGQLGDFLGEVWMIAHMVSIYPLLLGVMFCSYGKEFGKLLVTKCGDALLAKVICMLFPIVTWILSLITFAITGTFGEGLDPVASPVRLTGLVLVGISCIGFVVFQKKKM